MNFYSSILHPVAFYLYYGKKVQSTQQMVGVIYLFIATCFGRFWPSSGNNIDNLYENYKQYNYLFTQRIRCYIYDVVYVAIVYKGFYVEVNM
jgi:hypothetical protein